MHYHNADKENSHPNIPTKVFKVKQQDFSSIGKQYVVDGDRVRVKSIHYRDDFKMMKEKQEKPQEKMMNLEQIDEAQIQKLQYLEKMGVINEEEKKILEGIRKFRKPKANPFIEPNRNMRQPMTKNHYFNIPAQIYSQQSNNFEECEEEMYPYEGENQRYY